MAIYERTLVSGKVDRIDTEKNFIDPTTQSLLAENQQDAKKMIERHRAENPNYGGDIIPYIKVSQ